MAHKHYIVKNISLSQPLLLHSLLIIWREMLTFKLCDGLDTDKISACPAQAMSTHLLQTAHTATIHCLCQNTCQNTFKTLNIDSKIDICAPIIQATGINIYLTMKEGISGRLFECPLIISRIAYPFNITFGGFSGDPGHAELMIYTSE